jgi:hypothetical protein
MTNVAERSLSLRGRRDGSLNAAVRRRRPPHLYMVCLHLHMSEHTVALTIA